MKMKCILLYAMPYSIIDDKTGFVNEGISCTYVPAENLEPVEADDSNGAMGIMTCKQSFSTDLLDNFVAVPGLYEIDFKLKSVKGKPTMTPDNITFVSNIEFSKKG